MPVYETTRSIEVAASATDCFAVLTDYEQMPEWQTRVLRCQVLARDCEGLGEEVEYEIDAKLRTVSYRLRHSYKRPHWIGSEYLGGDFRCFEGDYAFTDGADTTQVRFHLRIDPGLHVPAAVVRMLNQAVMGRSLQDLKRRVEAPANGTH